MFEPIRTAALVLALVLLGAVPATAQKAPPTASERETEIQAAVTAAYGAALRGPQVIRLGSQGSIALPSGYQFIPQAEAQRFMRAVGNRTGSSFIGLIVANSDKDTWLVTIDFLAEGYIKDDDAKSWNADDLLKSLREGTDAANADRRERGFPELEVGGWVERPHYDPEKHRLIWSALARNKGAAPGTRESVNYNTYALGREGYYKLNLITGSDNIGGDKLHARALLAALSYDDGRRYEDFNASTDRVAEYGLAALIAGAAAKKLGLLAAIGVFFLKFWKIAAIGVIGLGAAARKFFGRTPPPTA